MPTNASRLSDFSSGIGTQGAVLKVDNANQRIGIGTTNPQAMLQVGTGVSVYGNSGIVSATSFYGDGSNLSGITAGATLSAGSGSQRIVVTSLTSGTMTSAATDAELVYNSDTNTLTATTFSGALSGNATSATNASGLTGTPDITVNNVVGAAATFSGNVSIAGTLTYEDVTNVDSIGIVTARSGVRITTGGIEVTAGVSTFSGEQRVSTIAEKNVIIDGNTATLTYAGSSANVAICTNPSGNITLNINSIPTDSTFDNHNLTFAMVVNSTGTARTCTAVNLNGVSKTINWAGGSLDAAIAGVTTTNGYTVQSFTGINTVGSASTTDNYTVFGVVSGGFF